MDQKIKNIIHNFIIAIRNWFKRTFLYRFLCFSYPFLIPFLLWLVAYYLGFILLKSEGILGWHISFEGSLFFFGGIFFTLFLYRLESKKNDGKIILELKKYKKNKLVLKLKNDSKKNYLKSVVSYIYSSDSKVIFPHHRENTACNLTDVFFNKYPNGICFSNHRLGSIPINDDIWIDINLSNIVSERIFFKFQVKAENIDECVQKYEVIMKDKEIFRIVLKKN
jgi:hypothetical protein